MPELPEVETTRSSLAARVPGARILAVRLGSPLRWPLGVAPASLEGRSIASIQRRGKYLWLALDGRGDGLLMHLGMSGSIAWLEPGSVAAPGKHDHFDLRTDRGLLRLTDPRRFGAVVWSPGLQAPPAATLLGRLGPEPFDPALTAQAFHASLQGHRAAIKTVLLSGRAIVGAGNIYACEALFDAGIDPRTRADRLSRPRAARLLEALRAVLARAIEAGGSTLRDFRDAHGRSGGFQDLARVYGREGLPCPICERPVRRIVSAQRSTFFCSHCQRRG